MDILEILVAARAKIADPENWCIGTLAEDACKNTVEPWAPAAIRWCAQGAIFSIVRHGGGTQDYALQVLSILRGTAGTTVHMVNDIGGHAAILALFDRAIARLQPPKPTDIGIFTQLLATPAQELEAA